MAGTARRSGPTARRSIFALGATAIASVLVVIACAPTASGFPSTSPSASVLPPSLPPTASPPTSPPVPIGPVDSRVAAGGAHTCALTDGGGVSCWGALNGSFVPLDVPGLYEIAALAAGGQHSCALSSEGAVSCWGGNDNGQLGDGTTNASTTPVSVSGLTSNTIAIASGEGHTCAVSGAGEVKCWGLNEQNQLGTTTPTASLIPVDVPGLASGVIAIAAGGFHTCALTIAGGLQCWGANWSGQLGNGTTDDSDAPVNVTGLASGVSAVVAGGEHTCALLSTGRVSCWGEGEAGQLGNGASSGGFLDSALPVDVSRIGSGSTAIAAGGNQTCALANDGSLTCWGSNVASSAGNTSIPIDVSLGDRVETIAVGGAHACALRSDQAVMCWGWNYFGQLGLGARCAVNSQVPADVVFSAPGVGSVTGPTPGPIEHESGPRDVLLRFDLVVNLRDISTIIDEAPGVWFAPGAEFTLYGDGTAIVRNDLAQPPPDEGPIVRGGPFRIALLDEGQVQSLLRFALDEGGLREACDGYASQVDSDKYLVLTIRAGGLDRSIRVAGPSPLGPLMDRLRDFGVGDGIPTQVFVPARYWGSLIDVGSLADAGTVAWPWTGIAPGDFVVPAQYAFVSEGRRIMSAKEAAALGLSAKGGVVQRIYLHAPIGATVYAFSMWPMLPDDPG